jgi:hypothetical protein
MSRHLDDTGAGHPILGFLDLLERGLDDIADTPAWSLTAAETTAVITRLETDLARLAELEARSLCQAKNLDLPGEIGARSLSSWLAKQTRMTGGEAARRVRLAKTLNTHPQTKQAVATGQVLPEQAAVIGQAVDRLDDEYAGERAEAEQYLLDKAAEFDANKLAELGRRLFEVIDPDGADEHEAKLLAKQEARARKLTEFRLWTDPDGLSHGKFTLPAAQASMLNKALKALAAPKHVRSQEGVGSYDHEKPTPQRMGWAFMEYIERYPTDRLPKQGGLAATVVVTAEADVFTKGAKKTGRTDTGVGVSPGQLLRWACEAKVMPAILDTTGHVLDLGRSRRFHTEPQRLALIIEQQTCQHPTCDTPGSFCHVHHTKAWKNGGSTNTQDAVLLCPFHHHQAHADDIDYPIRT